MNEHDVRVRAAIEKLAGDYGVTVVAHYTISIPGQQHPAGHFMGDVRTVVSLPSGQHPSCVAVQLGAIMTTFHQRISAMLDHAYRVWIDMWADRDHTWAKDIQKGAAIDQLAKEATAAAAKTNKFTN